MAVKLTTAQVSQLLPWLEEHLPYSFKMTNRDGDSVPVKIVEGIYGVKDEALSDLLADPVVLTWDTRFVICAATERLGPVLLKLVKDKGQSAVVKSSILMKATAADLKPTPVPEGMGLHPVSSATDAKIVHYTWKYSSIVPEIYTQHFVQRFPSVFLVTDNGQHVGHMIGTSYGAMAMLHVKREFRRKGYAKVIVSQLAQAYFDRGEDAYVFVEEDNEASFNLHQNLGFRTVSELKFMFITVGHF